MMRLLGLQAPLKGTTLITGERNAECPCGSGKKHEKCCQGRISVSLAPVTAGQLQDVLVLCHAGNLAAADRACQALLTADTGNAEVLRLQGLIAHRAGQHERAVLLIRQALQHAPVQAAWHLELGLVYGELERLDEAIDCFRQAITHNPDYGLAQYNLGNAYSRQNRLDLAIACFEQACSVHPAFAEAWYNLAAAYSNMGRTEPAITCYQRLLALQPNHPAALHNLARLYCKQRQLEQAVFWYRKAQECTPDNPDIYFDLGLAFVELSLLEKAIVCYRQVVALQPDHAVAWYNLGTAYYDSNSFQAAVDSYHKALAIRPEFTEAWGNLGNCLKDLGQHRNAIRCYRRALDTSADLKTYANLLLLLQYADSYSIQQIAAEHRAFGERFEAPLRNGWLPHLNERTPERRLKIGYVSPDFRNHAVAYFVELLIERHDRKQVEVFCYYNHAVADSVTDRFKAAADQWRDVPDLDDDSLAALIRADSIDILVDLAGHTARGRLLTFAHKPAPVQVTWLGHPNTTGLTAMDWRITDAIADPAGVDDHYTETLYRLPGRPFCAYRPYIRHPEQRYDPAYVVGPTPGLANGFITFGCCNNYAKLTDPVVALWSRILKRVPGSRLLLEARGLTTPELAEQVYRRFLSHGISPQRLMLHSLDPEQQYLRYHIIDIALDPFPANGGTTTCDLLWMGVPLVTLAGDTFVSRMGGTFLEAVGHAEWIADAEDAYLQIAVALAGDLEQLNTIRLGLRQQVEQSPLMDEVGFVADIEAAYRVIWQRWCASVV